MEDLTGLISAFTATVASGQTEVYNEFSLQHELGIFLRGQLPNFKVQFERNVSHFFGCKIPCTKCEIDIAVFSADKKVLRYAIELKYPRNGQYPNQMFRFCEDIAFAEELHSAGFSATCLVIFADDRNFYEGKAEGIYAYFRGRQPVHGRITMPTGKSNEEVFVRGNYSIRWQPIFGALKYALVEVEGMSQTEPIASAPYSLAGIETEN